MGFERLGVRTSRRSGSWIMSPFSLTSLPPVASLSVKPGITIVIPTLPDSSTRKVSKNCKTPALAPCGSAQDHRHRSDDERCLGIRSMDDMWWHAWGRGFTYIVDSFTGMRQPASDRSNHHDLAFRSAQLGKREMRHVNWPPEIRILQPQMKPSEKIDRIEL